MSNLLRWPSINAWVVALKNVSAFICFFLGAPCQRERPLELLSSCRPSSLYISHLNILLWNCMAKWTETRAIFLYMYIVHVNSRIKSNLISFHFINQIYRELSKMKFKTSIYKIYNFVQKHPMMVSRKICSYDFCLTFAYFRQILGNPIAYVILLFKHLFKFQLNWVEHFVFIDSLTTFYP
jgi:hypothetical protein